MERADLIIFVKNPVAGKVKTRLAASLGNEKALDIYKQLLAITRIAATAANCRKHLFYSDKVETDEWIEPTFSKYVQQGNALGDRMRLALDTIFSAGGKRVIIIGSDCPQLTSTIIDDAFSMLNEKDVVVGPAKDGGYYLLGMKKPLPFLFAEKEWSTDSVFDDTVVDLLENRLSYGRLPVLSDVDNIYDLHLLSDRSSEW